MVPTPDAERCALTWTLTVKPGESTDLRLIVEVSEPDAVVKAADSRPTWRRPDVTADDRRLPALVAQSLDDLHSLRLATAASPGDTFLGAGIPWFFTLFGRDSLWAARMLLPLGTDLALGTLRTLAAQQGTRTHPAAEEELEGLRGRSPVRRRPPRPSPLALAEVQGYAYEAALAGAALLDAFELPDGERRRNFAADLADRFRAHGPPPGHRHTQLRRPDRVAFSTRRTDRRGTSGAAGLRDRAVPSGGSDRTRQEAVTDSMGPTTAAHRSAGARSRSTATAAKDMRRRPPRTAQQRIAEMGRPPPPKFSTGGQLTCGGTASSGFARQAAATETGVPPMSLQDGTPSAWAR